MTGRSASGRRVGQSATVPPRAPRSQRKPSGPSLSRWTRENGSPSRLPITHHAHWDPPSSSPMIHPARWDPAFTQPGGGIGPCRCGLPLPAPFIAADRRVAPRFALFGRSSRPSPEKSAHSPLPGCRGARSGVRWAASRACLGPLGVSGGFGRVRRLLCAGARVSDDIRRYGCPARPWAGHPYLQRESSPVRAAVDPHRNDGPSRPETTRAESVEPPTRPRLGTGPTRHFSGKAPRPSAS